MVLLIIEMQCMKRV